MTNIPECCNTCKKRITVNGKGRLDCAVLTSPGAWGPNCTAWTDDPDWEAKTDKAMIDVYGKYGRRLVAERRKRGGVRG